MRIQALSVLLILCSLAGISQDKIELEIEQALLKGDFTLIQSWNWDENVQLRLTGTMKELQSDEAISTLSEEASSLEIASIEFEEINDPSADIVIGAELETKDGVIYFFGCEAKDTEHGWLIITVMFVKALNPDLLGITDDQEEMLALESLVEESDDEPTGDLELVESEDRDFDDDGIFDVVELMPAFPGCENLEGGERQECTEREVRAFLRTHLQFPEDLKNAGIQGAVYVRYEVDKQGDVKNAEVLRGVHPKYDEVALKLVNTLPRHEPGKQAGKVVRVQYTVPVKFVIK